MTDRRLIEESFPLQEVSEHSRHEKNVRHGHISTLHIWPARRPLAASRAAIIAALMPDPGDEAERQKLNKKIASITKWKTENGPALDFFREEIRKAFGGRPPRVLDMFAGGGAIPLEAMRLGCDVTAIDYNPVAWFILKCTLEFPHRLADKTWPLPQSGGKKKGAQASQMSLGLAEPTGKQGTLADHVRYWGKWVLQRARVELTPYYPTLDGHPTVGYLWARTVPCPDPKCGTTVPLLKTLWLSKKAEKTLPDTAENRTRPDFLRIKRTKNTSKVVINGRRALRLIPPEKGQGERVRFEVWTPGLKERVPKGTMSGSHIQCPCCGVNMTAQYIKECGQNNLLDIQLTSVVIDAGYGRDYRRVSTADEDAANAAESSLTNAFGRLPFGVLNSPLPTKERHRAVGSQLPKYGFRTWADLFTNRQLLALATFTFWIRAVRDEMLVLNYPSDWVESVTSYLALGLDRLADRSSSLCRPDPTPTQSGVINTFSRFALPMTWDFIEGVTISTGSGGFFGSLEWIIKVLEHLQISLSNGPSPQIVRANAQTIDVEDYDAVVTDPPYYDAIPYSDISDFFYVWLRRTIGDVYPEVLSGDLSPKAGELVQQHRSGNAGRKGKLAYESGMTKAFQQASRALKSNGRLVMVFAHKEPDAWETLVSAIIRTGFVVTASWPIDTEMGNRTRASASAALSSSIWLVCRKRATNSGVGRYRSVRKAMEERVTERLRYFWDIGLSGPDFVWAAIGPALEPYSSYDEVKRLDGSPFTVSDFLKDVRRMVADFALGQILKGHSTEGLDEWTRYYLMHRNNFGLEDAPVGECILLSQGYGLDLNDLRSDRGFIVKSSGSNVRLAKWDERTRDDLGDPHPSGGLPLIDMLHRLMRLWSAGSLDALNSYAAENGLRQNDLFWAVAQAILEMAPAQSRERTLLEALVAWGRGKTVPTAEKLELPLTFTEGDS